MRSRAAFKAHPIHPSLIPFPFAFLWGAALFDVAYLVTGRAALTTTAAHLTLAGAAAAVLAAIPGIIDYVYAVPPNSSGKKRATRHAAGNLTAVVLFLVAWWLRHPDGTMSMMTLVLEVAGAALLSYASLLGGELVIRNMVSVDHRYANAGRWSEAAFPEGTKRIDAAGEDELEEGHMKLLRVGSRRIVLARTKKGYCAFEDRCTHRGGSLAGGVLIGETVQCLWHGSQFDVRSGKVVCGPAEEGVAVFPTAVEKGRVTVTPS